VYLLTGKFHSQPSHEVKVKFDSFC